MPKDKQLAKENNHDLPDECKEALKYLIKIFDEEDEVFRKYQLRLWAKHENFWHGLQHLYWSETRQSWITPSSPQWFGDSEGKSDGPFYDFVINIFKAHGEAVIAALSANTPSVRFPPDDASDDDDLQTSRTFAKISDLIDRHNAVKKLQLTSLLIAWNQGNIYWYHASKADKAFGVTHLENFKKGLVCEQCQMSVEMEDDDDLLDGLHHCKQCGGPMQVRPVLDGYQESPKTRVIIDAFGGTHVKVPCWAREQKDCGYLIKTLDQPKGFLKYVYPHIADKIEKSSKDSAGSESIARTPKSLSANGRAGDNPNLMPHKQIWLRSWVLEYLPEHMEGAKKKLAKLFPNGMYVSYVGKEYAESRDEDLDKHWTICKTGLSTYIHADALGQPLVPLQELRNAVANLTIETVEQGMSTTFADPEVLNFEDFGEHEARPGTIYPAKAPPGQPMGRFFYETGRATLSKEVGPFQQQIDKDGQFVVGSFPSLYGGPGEGKSRTLGEYTQSRQQALQRLSICWSLFVQSWAKLKEKCVHLYVENLIDDEKFVTPDPKQKENYVNIWIRKADLTGKVGEVEAEGADSFPISLPQQQALFFKLLEMNNEFINSALFSPENRRKIADLTGFTDLAIPGENQRMKQSSEISDIIEGLPVTVDAVVDDHQIHVETAREYLVSSIGLDLKKSNPMAYMAIEQHIQQHGQVINAQTNTQFRGTPPGVPPPHKGDPQ